ncbi:hypothetical protein GCM10020220_046320 [Nonomuraea rubra]
MLDDVTISLRDLAYLMIALSDNTAADKLLGRVGFEVINTMLEAFGLKETRVVQGSGEMLGSMDVDTGHAWPFVDPDDITRLSVLDPARTNRSTAREMARLFGMIWRDEAASAPSCAWMRGVLNMQVWPHRMASGFPYDDVAVSGKTGTMPTLRCETGVVEYPDGGRYAVVGLHPLLRHRAHPAARRRGDRHGRAYGGGPTYGGSKLWGRPGMNSPRTGDRMRHMVAEASFSGSRAKRSSSPPG